MNSLSELKTRIMEQAKVYWTRFLESSFFAQAKEKFYEFSPRVQKLIIVGSFVVALFLIYFIPLISFQSSSSHITQFEENTKTIRDLLHVQRELAQAPDVEDPPASSVLLTKVRDLATQAGVGPEQIKGETEINPRTESTLIPKAVTQNGVELTLVKLNLKQVVDIGSKLESISPFVHLIGLDMKANAENNHYYDVIYRLVGFTMPNAAPEPATPPSKPKKEG